MDSVRHMRMPGRLGLRHRTVRTHCSSPQQQQKLGPPPPAASSLGQKSKAIATH